MTSPRLPAIALNACLLVGCAAVVVARSAPQEGEPVTNPLGAGRSVQLEPVPGRERPGKSRTVFVCRGPGPVIFSDTPCGPQVQELRIQPPAPTPGRAASTRPEPPSAATRPRPAQSEPKPADGERESRCRSMRRQLDKLDDRMRSGYSAREAARLWNRWRELKSEIYAERC